MKRTQLNEIERMQNEKKCLQEKAESLAVKYEDAKDKQNELLKRFEFKLISGIFGLISCGLFQV